MCKKLLILTLMATLFYAPNTASPLIRNINDFIDECPTNDPAYPLISNDFHIRRNGIPVNDFACYFPVSTMDVSDYTDELLTLQGLRIIYYMDLEKSNYLPWTNDNLYDWLKSKVAGINIDDMAQSPWCCDTFADGKYIVMPPEDDFNMDYDRTWNGLSGNISVYVHEARHCDGFGHTSCCSIPYGCDQSFDMTYLSSFGVQWWLYDSWLTGNISSGYSCLDISSIISIAATEREDCNSYRDRFCDIQPPLVDIPVNPGGPCLSSETSILTILPMQQNAGSITINSSQITCGNNTRHPCQFFYPRGTSLNLLATPNSGWLFKYWGDGDTYYTDPHLNIIINDDTTLTLSLEQPTDLTGSLTTVISPHDAIDLGARWRVAGENAWRNSGATVDNLPAGQAIVEFNNIPGWTRPGSQGVTITPEQTANVTGTYVQNKAGSLTASISPPEAVSAGAMWRVDGGSWQASGALTDGLSEGAHTVDFRDVAGWTGPPEQQVNISSGRVASTTGTYTPAFAAGFTADTRSGKAPLAVRFFDQSTGSVQKWLWKFGDGKTSKVKNPSHTYKPGAYTVALTVTGSSGTSTVTQPDYITAYARPKANGSATPKSGKVPLTVSFTDESTGVITSWLWDFKDGATSTEPSPEHTYTASGIYSVKLTVTGPGGTSSKTLKVKAVK